MVAPMVKQGVRSFTLTEKAEADYNSWLHKRANNTVWSQCSSWYRHGNGKIVAAVSRMYPPSQGLVLMQELTFLCRARSDSGLAQ